MKNLTITVALSDEQAALIPALAAAHQSATRERLDDDNAIISEPDLVEHALRLGVSELTALYFSDGVPMSAAARGNLES